MARSKKIQLKRRSGPSARIHRGLSMPVGPGSDNEIFCTFRKTGPPSFYYADTHFDVCPIYVFGYPV